MLENTTKLFYEATYDRICRDDGLVIMIRVKTNNEIGEWLSSFQKEVNIVTGYK
jgi:hypothetical protein